MKKRYRNEKSSISRNNGKRKLLALPPSQLPSDIFIFLFNPLEIFLMMIKQNIYNPQPQSNAKIADLIKKEPPSWILSV